MDPTILTSAIATGSNSAASTDEIRGASSGRRRPRDSRSRWIPTVATAPTRCRCGDFRRSEVLRVADCRARAAMRRSSAVPMQRRLDGLDVNAADPVGIVRPPLARRSPRKRRARSFPLPPWS